MVIKLTVTKHTKPKDQNISYYGVKTHQTRYQLPQAIVNDILLTMDLELCIHGKSISYEDDWKNKYIEKATVVYRSDKRSG